ncbi:MAG: TonB-dependent receptor plug domain-containing protein [Planctomycetota bacterium]
MNPTTHGCKWLALILFCAAATSAQSDAPQFQWLEFAENLRLQQEIKQVALQDIDLPEIPEPESETISNRAEQPIDVDLPTFDSIADEPSLTSLFKQWDSPAQLELAPTLTNPVENAGFVEALEETQGTSEVALTEAPAVDIVGASTFDLVATPDVGETLTSAPTTQAVKARRRSPVGFDPRIRGFYTGQIYATHDGAYQFPIRSDLDGVFSKIDQSLIGNVQVYSGPYTVRYGSGFAFLNVDTIATPRYECGWENHLRTGMNLRTNGGQTYSTTTVYGGGEGAGYFVNLGHRQGSDYQSGGSLLVPASYDAFNLFSGFGFDHDDNTRSEIRYSLVDQQDTEYAGQFFDVDDLNSNHLSYSLIHRDERSGFAYRVDTWAGYTEFDGDTDNGSKRRDDFPVLQRVDEAILRGSGVTQVGDGFSGDVDGEMASSGIRAGFTQEIDRDRTIGAGVDFRYLRQEIGEEFDLNGFESGGTSLGSIFTGLPSAEVFEPGVYTEYSFAPRDFIQTAIGARIAFASTRADANDVNASSNFRDVGTGVINEDLDVSDVLGSFFLTNDIELSPAWSARVGVGYAERLPNLEQRYSDGLFLASIQSGFSRVIGNPTLRKERNWQADIRFDAEYEYVRSRLNLFHSWILDYVTYEANEILDPTGARLLQAINTDYATLTGFEYYGEADLNDGWQTFFSLAFLDGRDREIDQPLAGINPLESRLGIRFSDTGAENNWGIEWGWRIVDNQDRVGTLRAVAPATGVVQLETETPGFATSYLRGYLRPSRGVNIVFGAENLFDRTYFEHLNLRLPADSNFIDTVVLSPGLTPYGGIEIDY